MYSKISANDIPGRQANKNEIDRIKKQCLITRITSEIKKRLPLKYKIYEVIIFLNSTRDVCNDIFPGQAEYTANCELILSNLQSDYGDSSFLRKLKSELKKEDYIVVSSNDLNKRNKKEQTRPKCLFLVGANELYKNCYYSSARLKENANKAFSGEAPGYMIDVKRLAGKAIPSVTIGSIFKVSGETKKGEEEKQLPKLTGFHSCNYHGNDDTPDKILAKRAQSYQNMKTNFFNPNQQELEKKSNDNNNDDELKISGFN